MSRRRMRTYGRIHDKKPSASQEAPTWPAMIDDKIEDEKVEAVGEREEETHTERGDLPNSFEELGLDENLLSAIKEMGYNEPTLIQAATIPGLIAGDDVMGQAKTGTGKTAAFCLPALQKIVLEQPSVQAMVLCPTRELCQQVQKEVEKFAKHSPVGSLAIYGGQPMATQLAGLKKNPQFVVGTPGRVIDHIRRGTLDLHQVQYAVLDEADEMLDMGFIDDIRFILQQTPKTRQTALFSATFPVSIRRLARGNMNNPRVIHTSGKRLTVESITQVFYEVPEPQKFKVLCNMLDQDELEQAVVFVRTKWETDVLTRKLQMKGHEVKALHGDLPQSVRTRHMQEFRDGKLDVLIATDVAARGLDISAVSHVINYHLPQDPEVYVHRIGRTGRMGKEGWAISLVDPKDYHQLMEIQNRADVTIEQRELPSGEELEARRRVKVAAALAEEASSAEELEAFGPAAEKLLASVENKAKLVAFLYKQIFETRFPPKPVITEESFGDTGAEKGHVRLYLNVGKDHDIGPGDLVKAVASAGGIEGSQVGRIELFGHFSFVQVPTECGVQVLAGLEDHIIADQQLQVAPAKPNRSRDRDDRPRSRDRDRGRDRDRDRDRDGDGEDRKRRSRGRGRDRDRDGEGDGERKPRRRRGRGRDDEGERSSKPRSEGEGSEARSDGEERPKAASEAPKGEGREARSDGDGEDRPRRKRRRRRRRRGGSRDGEGDGARAEGGGKDREGGEKRSNGESAPRAEASSNGGDAPKAEAKPSGGEAPKAEAKPASEPKPEPKPEAKPAAAPAPGASWGALPSND